MSPPAIRLVLIDVDGTLFGPQGVPRCAWQAAKRARSAGLRLSICTGRPGGGLALEYAQRLDPDGWHIFESGAVVRAGRGPVVRALTLPPAVYSRLLELSRAHRVPFEVYTAHGGFYRESDHPDLLAHQAMLGFPAEVRDLASLADPVVRVQFVARPSPRWRAVEAALRGLPGLERHLATSPGMPGVRFYALTAAGASKRAAAEWVAGRMGFSLRQCAMVGDGENDLELIRAAGLGIAMGNAPPLVRRAADRVVARVEDCGLEEALALVQAWPGLG